MDRTPIIGERLKALIKETGLEQQTVAGMLGIKTPTFNSYVNNNREPPVVTLMKIAAHFNVSIDYLTGYSDVRDPYLTHLPEELRAFVREHENKLYLELAKDIKTRTLEAERNRPKPVEAPVKKKQKRKE